MLHRVEHTERVVAVAVEGEHGVDQMLDRPRPREVPVLGHVPDEKDRDTTRLGQARQALDARPHLGQAACRLGQLGVRDGLQRVDHDEGGPRPPDRIFDRVDVGALEREQVRWHRAEARRPPADLGQ